MASTKPESIEDYIAGFPVEVQVRLKQMRSTIKKAAPKAEEVIRYNMPLYKWNGTLISFAAWKAHIGLYPSPVVTGEMKKKLSPFEGSKATLKFPIDKPLPLPLISKIVKLRLKENDARAKRKSKKEK